MNTILLSVDSVQSDLSEFTILDGTTYSSPARSAVGNFLTVQKMSAESTVVETLAITADDSDPETDSEWVVPYTAGDGYYRATFVSVPDYDVADTYEIYDAVFDAATNKVWRSKQNGNVGQALAAGAYWEEITGNDIGLLALNEDEATESVNLDSTLFEFVMTGNAEKAYATQIALASEQYLTSTFIPDDELDSFSIMSVLLNGAIVASDRGTYTISERILDRFTSIVEAQS